MDPVYVQYGCGLSAPATWRNFDASPTLRLQRVPLIGRFVRGGSFPDFPPGVEYGDVVRGLPVAAASCRAVYCSHVLEHLALEDLRTALRHTRAYLEPGGVFRFVLPDLEFLARAYLESADADAAPRFMEATHLGRTHRPRGIAAIAREWLGSAAHRWMWDAKSLAAELDRAGFRDARRARFGDAADRRFDDVEDPGRWENCLGMECRR